jgi:hypothetical protein
MANKGHWDSFFHGDSDLSEDFVRDQDESILSRKEIIIRVTVDLNRPETFPKGFINKDMLDATSEAQIKLHQKEDDDQSRLEALNKKA